MKSNNSEMSLDEVLSSIKEMVIADEPPVLELTNMVSDNGEIVDVKNMSSKPVQSDMGSFLKLIQENTNGEVTSDNIGVCKNSQNIKCASSKIPDAIREMATPLIQKWVNENMRNLVKEIVEAEIKKIITK